MISKAEATLLLVEDDDVDAMTIERAFTKLKIGNKPVRACDGLEALEILNTGAVPSPLLYYSIYKCRE